MSWFECHFTFYLICRLEKTRTTVLRSLTFSIRLVCHKMSKNRLIPVKAINKYQLKHDGFKIQIWKRYAKTRTRNLPLSRVWSDGLANKKPHHLDGHLPTFLIMSLNGYSWLLIGVWSWDINLWFVRILNSNSYSKLYMTFLRWLLAVYFGPIFNKASERVFEKIP